MINVKNIEKYIISNLYIMKINILKYLVFTFIIHSLLAYGTCNKLSQLNIFVITFTLTFFIIFIDNFYSFKDHIESFISTNKFTKEYFDLFNKNESYEKEQNEELVNEIKKPIEEKSIKSFEENNIDKHEILKEPKEKQIEPFEPINIGQPEILKELEDRKILNRQKIDNLISMCSDKDKCLLKLNSYLNDKMIDNKEMIELQIIFGLEKLDSIQELYLQERISRDDAFEIANAIRSNSKPILTSTLSYLVGQNKLTNNDAEKILAKVTINDDYSDGIVMLSNLINDGKIVASISKSINEKCSSQSIDSCSIHLNDLKEKKIINESEGIAILQAYNKPGVNSFYDFNTKFNDISNMDVIGSLDKNTDLGNVDFDERLLDENLEKQSLNPMNNIIENEKQKDEEKVEQNITNNINLKDEKGYYVRTMENDNYIQIQDIEKQDPNVEGIKYDNDLRYSKFSEKDYEYLGTYNKDFTNSFNHGSEYLNTNKWKPQEYDNTKCKIEEKCELCEEDYDEYPVNVNDFNKSKKILGKDDININYINDKLNSGLG